VQEGAGKMENSLSRILIETVDMALHFSGGRFQQRFFETAQGMLENKTSPYYGLVRDLTSYADAEHLLRFGMNLGYKQLHLRCPADQAE